MSLSFFDRSQWQHFLANVTAPARQLALHYYVLAIAVLSYFSNTVSPLIARQPSWEIIATFSVAFSWAWLIKLAIEPRLIDDAPVTERLTRQLYFDIFLFSYKSYYNKKCLFCH